MMNEIIKVIKHEKLIIAFIAGKTLVNSGASFGLGKFFEPIKVTSKNTTIVNNHIAILTPFFSSNCGEGFIAESAIVYLQLIC